MFGIIIGTISLVALIATLRRGRGGFGGASRGFRHVTSRLKASPSQEDALRTVADDLFATGRATREDGLALRQALISALEKDALEPTSLDDALGRFDTATERLRAALVTATEKVHATLDPSQRKTLIGMLSRGPFRRRHHHYAH
jgi:uncharacterized membrane protein